MAKQKENNDPVDQLAQTSNQRTREAATGDLRGDAETDTVRERIKMTIKRLRTTSNCAVTATELGVVLGEYRSRYRCSLLRF